ncbi:helix-turn-helix domain-containing protein [Azospirillum brasilense]|uniref:helix-turn-helix domain-containing protein n=2 Tax=Azospirillum brasilense TaxID=192 RepID=UPI00157B57BB|nr:helix-turn-helix transcriptional regulator [Azospirillum brasilense]
MTMVTEDIPKNRIRVLRKKARMTAADLADAVGMHVSMISKIETHQRKVMPDVADRIAEKLGVRPEELFSDSDVGSVQPRVPSSGAVSIPVVRWADLPVVMMGDTPEHVTRRVGVLSTSDRIVCLRIPRQATMLLGEGSTGADGIVDLRDREQRDGWWIGSVGREFTLLHRGKDGWTDALDEEAPTIPEAKVRLIGRLIEYRVSLDADSDDEDDIHVEETIEEMDEQTKGFLDKHGKKK